MNDLQTRRFTIRADADAEPRTVRGLAVPYGVEIELAPGYFESIAPGALADRADDATSLKLVWRHDEPIGLITSATETAEGIEIEARGSSPLTRGKRRARGRVHRQGRLIPTHAGKTSWCRRARVAWWAHPHSRGENAWVR